MKDRQPKGGEKSESTREPVAIRNRDIPVLCDVLPVMQLVCATEKRLDWQHDRMTAMSQHISGMPGGGTLPQGLDEAFAKLYETKTPITAADILNDRVLPFFDEHGIPLCRVLTDRGTEYCPCRDLP